MTDRYYNIKVKNYDTQGQSQTNSGNLLAESKLFFLASQLLHLPALRSRALNTG